ncbi:MAG: hypothetical protein M3N21_01510 [Actinomycetota bacterium]|nr:hypothetical protein [Actinomycetota bacterium]
MSRRLVRRSAGLFAAASVASVVALTTSPAHVQAAPGFACEPSLQQACAIVFGPVCRKPFQPCY